MAVGKCRAHQAAAVKGPTDPFYADESEEEENQGTNGVCRDTEKLIKPNIHVVHTRGLDHTAFHLLCLHRRDIVFPAGV